MRLRHGIASGCAINRRWPVNGCRPVNGCGPVNRTRAEFDGESRSRGSVAGPMMIVPAVMGPAVIVASIISITMISHLYHVGILRDFHCLGGQMIGNACLRGQGGIAEASSQQAARQKKGEIVSHCFTPALQYRP